MPVAVLVRFGVEKETVEAPQLQFFDFSVQSLDLGGVVPVVVRQMVGETLLCCSCCSLENLGHYFLSPFLTVPLRSVYASVMEAFGRISHFFLCEVFTDAVLDLVLACPSGATTSVLVETVPKTVWRFRSCSSCGNGRRCA